MPADLRFAFRSLVKNPFVSTIAIVSLALGIGPNAAMFSLVHQVLLRPLPVEDPSALVNLSAPGVKSGSNSCNDAGDCETVFSYPMFRDLEQAQTVFTGMAAHRSFTANLALGDETSVDDGMMVSGDYFPVLGLQAAAGRLIHPGDDTAIGASAVVVLSHAYWQERFGGDAGVLGEILVVNGQPMSVIGVAPPGFEGTTIGNLPRVYVPLTQYENLHPRQRGRMSDRRNYWLYVFARLRPGVDIEGARAALGGQYSAIVNEIEAPLQQGMSAATLEQFRAKQIGIEPGSRGQSAAHTEGVAPLSILEGITFLVLLIACANIANLLLGRAVGRSGEMAVRLSVGANRRHLVVQLLTESLLLAAAGGLTGLLVARWTLSGMVALLPPEAAGVIDTRLNPAVLAFTAAVACGSGIVFGLVPALLSTRPDVLTALKGQAGRASGARSAARFRTTLTTAQIALSMALLVAAGLFIRSLVAISRADLGLDAAGVVTFGISPERNGHEAGYARELYQRTEEALAALPGVTSVTAAVVPVLAGSTWGTSVAVEGFEAGPDTDTGSSLNLVGPDYFRTLGITLLAGREFTAADTSGAPQVAIVNEAFARKFGLDRDAVGRRMRSGSGDELDIEIVGLVEDARYSSVRRAVPPLFYRPYRQSDSIGSITFYARSELDPRQQLSAIAPLVARLDADLPVENLRTLQAQVEQSTYGERVLGLLSAAFAALATGLAAVGLYGVLAYTVAQRQREIGLRLALGADPARVRRMIFRRTALLTAVGGIIGLLVAVALGVALRSLLFEISGYDPLVLGAATALLTLIALGAGIVPAHRAARVDPIVALRAD